MELKFILESLLFSAQKPLSPAELREVFANAAEQEDADATVKSLKKVKEGELNAALEQLVKEHEAAGLRTVAQSAGGREGPSFAAHAAVAGNARHHRVSPAAHARGDRAFSRRERGRRDADFAGTWTSRSDRSR